MTISFDLRSLFAILQAQTEEGGMLKTATRNFESTFVKFITHISLEKEKIKRK